LADRPGTSRATLAQRLGVSRARVTQVLGLLDLAPQVVEHIIALGDPLPGPVVTERSLPGLVGLPAHNQQRALEQMFARRNGGMSGV